MRLEVSINAALYAIDVSDALMHEAEGFFEQMDRSMNGGWQISRTWVESPNNMQRCQIAADKILGALTQENHPLAELAAAYILKKMPTTRRVYIDTDGDIFNTRFSSN